MSNIGIEKPETSIAHGEMFDIITRGSWYEATELIKARIAWLEHMPESEPTKEHQKQILAACRAFYMKIQPLVAHYIDGDPI